YDGRSTYYGSIAPSTHRGLRGFELKHGLLTLVQNKQFFGHDKEDPHAHVRYFNKITSTLKFPNVLNTSIKLMLFLFSLEGAARIWLEKELPRSIFTWDDLVSKFINQFFPPPKTTNLRNEITNFQQHFDESFSEAWDRFKDLLRACHHHGFSKLHQLDTFYNVLNLKDQDSLNSAAVGNFLDKMPRECLAIIKSKSKVRYSRNKPVVAKVGMNTSTSGISPDVVELKDMVKALLLDKKGQNQSPAPVKAVEESCVNCGGAHSYRNFPTTDGNVYRDNIQEFVSQASAVNYNQENTSYRLTMMFNQIRPHGFPPIPNNQNVEQSKPFHSKSKSGKQFQPRTCLSTPGFPTSRLPSSGYSNTSASTSSSGTLPSNIIANPISDLKEITTRTGVSYDGPQIPPPPSFLPKLSEMARTSLNEHCSAVLLKKLPEKLGDPDKFLIPCDFPEDLYVKVGSFHFLADFVVEDFDADPRVPLILGRSFLKTRRALIDVFEGELTLRVGKEAITFNLDQTSRYLANYSDMTAKRIDLIDMAYEEYSQEVLGFSDVISSGNPTPYYDPIISTTSPTLTPFRNSNFLLEEVDAFLAIEDDPTSLEFYQPYLDHEGDILLLEAFLNDDPSLPPPNQGNYLPEVHKELKICEAKSDKSSVDEPPEVELKDLPPHLEYEFLEGDDKLSVIIAKDLSVEEKIALITVLKTHKRAIAWKLSNIKGIDPEFYTHIILMEEDFEPACLYFELGTLPSNTIANLIIDLKAITTRSGVSYDRPQIPPSTFFLHKVVEIEPEATKDTMNPTNKGSIEDVQPQIFRDMSFKISFSDALILMPKLALTLKALIGIKEKLSEMARTPLNEYCSTALADLGASINLMPFSVWKRLSLPDLTPTCMTLEIDDRLISRPVRVTEDVYVKVGSFHIPADFLVIDFAVYPRVPLILERSFLKTGRALIDVFEGDDKLLVIIAKDLSMEEKTAFITVLKTHKRAIAWKLSDIKGTDTEFYTHKILIEEDFEPPVQHQRRVNLKIYDFIKQEVIKLLEARLIYPISDSPWVSLVHCVPKKGGFMIVENEDNELIPTRLVMGWRVCIDYRKLKSHLSGLFTISQVYSYGTIELSKPNGPNFKVNGYRLKHYFVEDVPKIPRNLKTYDKGFCPSVFISSALFGNHLKRRVKKLEKGNRVRVLKLRRLKRVETSQRVDTSKDTMMDDAPNQGRIIDELDKDDAVDLMDDKEEDTKEEDANLLRMIKFRGGKQTPKLKFTWIMLHKF
nr:reverse transcriptase domain-containing protein [Tanacetum cinerariifolium]